MLNFIIYHKLLTEKMPRLSKDDEEVQRRYNVVSKLTESSRKAVKYTIAWNTTVKRYERRYLKARKVECEAKLSPLCLGVFVTKKETACLRCRHLVRKDV